MFLVFFYQLAMQTTQAVQSVGEAGMMDVMKYVIGGGSAAGMLFFIWWITFRFTSSREDKNSKERIEQFEKLLNQSQSQYEQSQTQNKVQQDAYLRSITEITERLFRSMDKDIENREYYAGVLTEIGKEMKMANHAIANLDNRQIEFQKVLERIDQKIKQ